MKKLIFILLVITNFSLYAQYTGGTGDGYASIEISLLNTSNNNHIPSDFIKVYPTSVIEGQYIHISNSFVTGINYKVIASNGIIVGKGEIKSGENISLSLKSGMYIFIAQSTEYMRSQKLVVY